MVDEMEGLDLVESLVVEVMGHSRSASERFEEKYLRTFFEAPWEASAVTFLLLC